MEQEEGVDPPLRLDFSKVQKNPRIGVDREVKSPTGKLGNLLAWQTLKPATLWVNFDLGGNTHRFYPRLKRMKGVVGEYYTFDSINDGIYVVYGRYMVYGINMLCRMANC